MASFSPNPNLVRAGLAITSSKICRAVLPSLTIFVPTISMDAPLGTGAGGATGSAVVLSWTGSPLACPQSSLRYPDSEEKGRPFR